MRKNQKSTRKAGRPPFKPTPAQRLTVSRAAGGGMAHDEIATALGISRNTLERYFAKELDQVAYRRRMEVVEAMHRSAVKGNVAAQKAYMALQPVNCVPPPDPGKEVPLGKKEAAEIAARGAEAGTGWEGDLPDHRTVQ